MAKKTDKENVVDGEWVDLETANEIAQTTGTEETAAAPAEALLQLDSIIRRYIEDIEKLKKEATEYRTMYNDSFNNDSEYHDINEKVKELNKKKKAIKDRITATESVMEVAAKMKDAREELTSANEMLAAYLERYVRQTGATTIEDNDGEVRTIVPVYKLVKKLPE